MKDSHGMRVERFDCTDGTHHFSVVDDADELATCVMHDTRTQAEAELAQLAHGVTEDRHQTFCTPNADDR